MLRSLLLSMISVLTFEITIAQDCEIKKDPFSNKEVQTYNFKNETLIFERSDGTVTVKLKFNLDGEINIAIKKGSSILLKTEKDKIIDLVTIEDAIPVSQVSGTRVISVVIFKCNLNEEMLKNMSESHVVLIRHPDGKGSQYDLEIGKGIGKGFQKGADCMLNSN